MTTDSTSHKAWMAWQFDDPKKSGGLVQAFRRAESSFVSAQFKLRELDPEASCLVTDYDAERPQQISGRELMEKGLLVTLGAAPGGGLDHV